MSLATLAVATFLLSIESGASSARFRFEGATVRAVQLRLGKLPIAIASVEGCPPSDTSATGSVAAEPAGNTLLSSTSPGGCSIAFLNRLRRELPGALGRTPSPAKLLSVDGCPLGQAVRGITRYTNEIRRLIPRDCLMAEVRDQRTDKPIALLISGPVAHAFPNISEEIERRFRERGLTMPVILLGANSPDVVDAVPPILPYPDTIATSLLRTFETGRRKPIGQIRLKSEGQVSLLRLDSHAILAVPAVPNGFLQRYLRRHLDVDRNLLLITNSGLMSEAVEFSGVSPGIRPLGQQIAFAAGRLVGRDPTTRVLPAMEDLRSPLQRKNAKWTLKLCGPAEAGVTGKFGPGAIVAGAGRLEVAPPPDSNPRSDASLAFWMHPVLPQQGSGVNCRPGNVAQGYGVAFSITRDCRLETGKNEPVAEIAPYGWTHVAIRVRGNQLTGSIVINGRRADFRRAKFGEQRWIVGGANSALWISDVAAWDRMVREDFVRFLIEGSIPKWTYPTKDPLPGDSSQ